MAFACPEVEFGNCPEAGILQLMGKSVDNPEAQPAN